VECDLLNTPGIHTDCVRNEEVLQRVKEERKYPTYNKMKKG
jgi:hypothetical protein